MEYAIVFLASFLASLVTFFSGFGLSTVLVAVYAILFPLPIAIFLAAGVHFLNGLLKVFLVGRFYHKTTLLYFGIPAVIAAFFGAEALKYSLGLPELFKYQILGSTYAVSPLKLFLALVILLVCFLDLKQKTLSWFFGKKSLVLGGLLSGFFGGFSGHQGALRSMFLVKAGLTKEQFIATTVLLSLMVDSIRIVIYSLDFTDLSQASSTVQDQPWLFLGAVLSAFLGSILGNKFLKKTNLAFIEVLVSIVLILFSVFLALGML